MSSTYMLSGKSAISARDVRMLIAGIVATRVLENLSIDRAETSPTLVSRRNRYASLPIRAQLPSRPFPLTRAPATTTPPTDSENTIATRWVAGEWADQRGVVPADG